MSQNTNEQQDMSENENEQMNELTEDVHNISLESPGLSINIPENSNVEEASPEEEEALSHTPTYSPHPVPSAPETPQSVIDQMESELDAMATEPDISMEEEKVETKAEEKTSDTSVSQENEESEVCGVCYLELTVDNVVNTSCNHKFCNKCFFKWMKVQSRCPMCRKHFETDIDLTDEEISRENRENYQNYITNLERYVGVCEMTRQCMGELSTLRRQRQDLMRCQISLTEQIEQTRGYNDGLTSALYTKGDIPDEIMMKYKLNKRFPNYLHGWRMGRQTEQNRLEKKKASLKRRRDGLHQPNLFAFGFNVESKKVVNPTVNVATTASSGTIPVFTFEPPNSDNQEEIVFSFNQ